MFEYSLDKQITLYHHGCSIAHDLNKILIAAPISDNTVEENSSGVSSEVELLEIV